MGDLGDLELWADPGGGHPSCTVSPCLGKQPAEPGFVCDPTSRSSVGQEVAHLVPGSRGFRLQPALRYPLIPNAASNRQLWPMDMPQTRGSTTFLLHVQGRLWGLLG